MERWNVCLRVALALVFVVLDPAIAWSYDCPCVKGPYPKDPKVLDTSKDAKGGIWKLTCTNKSETGDFVWSYKKNATAEDKVIGRCVYPGGKNETWIDFDPVNFNRKQWRHRCKNPKPIKVGDNKWKFEAIMDVFVKDSCKSTQRNLTIETDGTGTPTGDWKEASLRRETPESIYASFDPTDSNGDGFSDANLAWWTEHLYGPHAPPLYADYEDVVALATVSTRGGNSLRWNLDHIQPTLTPGDLIHFSGVTTHMITRLDPRYSATNEAGGVRLTAVTSVPLIPETELLALRMVGVDSLEIGYDVEDLGAGDFWHAVVEDPRPLEDLASIGQLDFSDAPGYASGTGGLTLRCRFDDPPHLSDVFPSGASRLRVLFDRAVTPATAGNPANYVLGSFGGVTSATVLDSFSVELSITSGLSPGDIETLTAQGIVSAETGFMMSSESSQFFNGVLTPSQIQAANPADLGALDCLDRTRYAATDDGLGRRLAIQGTCVARFGTLHYLANAAPSPRGCIGVVSRAQPLTPGTLYLVAGRAREARGETRIEDVAFVRVLGPGSGPPEQAQPIAVLTDETCDRTSSLTNGEDFEGLPVEVISARVVESDSCIHGGDFLIAEPVGNPTDTIPVHNAGNVYTYGAAPGDIVRVRGILMYRNARFEIAPRNNSDITRLGTVHTGPTDASSLNLRVYPNPGALRTIAFTLPRSSRVTLGIFDIAGRLVASLLESTLPAGPHSIPWRSESLRAGVYMVRLVTDHGTRAEQVAQIR